MGVEAGGRKGVARERVQCRRERAKKSRKGGGGEQESAKEKPHS